MLSLRLKRQLLTFLLLLRSCIPVISVPVVQVPGELGHYFEGDIRVSPTQSSTTDNVILKRMVQDMPAIEGSGYEENIEMEQLSGILWPNNTVYYKFDRDLDTKLRELFADAIRAWERDTCLEFKEVQSNEVQKAYLNFTSKLSCSSFVGRTGSMQEVSITYDCDRFGHAAHEIGHAIGLYHEHTRQDRDNYIRIIWENIEDRYENNFKRYSHNNSDSDVDYDFQSIMHYPLDAFAKELGVQTIIVKDTVKARMPDCIKKIGQRNELSYKDYLRVNKMYLCEAEVKQLEEMGDDCVLDLEGTTEPTTTEPPTRCKPVKSIATESIISITASDSKGIDDNIICSTTSCVKKACDWRSSCIFEKSFQIFMSKNRRNPLVKSGYTVALRNTYRNQWLDCSRSDGCRLTDCDQTPTGQITNYTNEICAVHHLELHAYDKKANKRVQTTDMFYIKAVGENKYLNCYGANCKLITEDSSDCLSSEESSGGSSGLDCKRTIFRIHKEIEECRWLDWLL